MNISDDYQFIMNILRTLNLSLCTKVVYTKDVSVSLSIILGWLKIGDFLHKNNITKNALRMLCIGHYFIPINSIESIINATKVNYFSKLCKFSAVFMEK